VSRLSEAYEILFAEILKSRWIPGWR